MLRFFKLTTRLVKHSHFIPNPIQYTFALPHKYFHTFPKLLEDVKEDAKEDAKTSELEKIAMAAVQARSAAQLSFANGDVSHAIIKFNEAIQYAEQANDVMAIFSLSLELAEVYRTARILDKCEEIYENLSQLIKKYEIQSSTEMQLESELGLLRGYQGRFDEAKMHFEKAKQLDVKNTLPWHCLWEEMGHLFSQNGNNEEAITYLRKSIEFNESLKDLGANRDEEIKLKAKDSYLFFKFQAMLQLAFCFAKTEKFEEAMSYSNEALSICKSINKEDSLELADTMSQVADVYLASREYEKGLDIINQSHNIFNIYKSTLQNPLVRDGFIYMMSLKVKLLIALFRYQEAIDLCKESISICEKYQMSFQLADFYELMAGIHMQNEKYYDALQLLYEAVKIYQQENLPKNLIITFKLISRIFFDMKTPKEAIPFLEESFKLLYKENMKDELYETYMELISLYSQFGLETKKDALILTAYEIGLDKKITNEIKDIGRKYVDQKKYNEALKALQLIENEIETLNDELDIAEIYDLIGQCFEALSNHESSLKYRKKAEHLYKKLGLLEE